MYLAYSIILAVLVLILIVTLKEEIMLRKGITHGIANKYWAMRERRRFVRFQEDMRIRYNHIDSKPDQSDARTRNISRAGLCLSTYEKLKKKDRLEIEIEVPGSSKPVKLTGSVMWIKELRSGDDQGRRMFYTGIMFRKISPDVEAVLITHLNTLKRS